MMFRWLTKAVTTLAGGLTLADPALARFVGGARDTPAGKCVSVESALQLSAVWACVRLISQTIATLPFMVYERNALGDRHVAADHPLYGLLHDQPNADMTAVEFWEAMVACVLLWGNAYARKDMNGQGDVISLTPMQPDRMAVRRLTDGSLLYTFSPWSGPPEEFNEDQLFHLKGWSINGMLGMSVISFGAASLGSAQAADEVAGKFFANGLAASGFVETGGAVLTEPQRAQFKAALNAFRGSSNAGKTMLLEGTFKYTPITLTPDDAQLLATRQFSIEEICRWFAVDPSLIGHGQAPGSALEQQMLRFLTTSLRPWLTRIEQRVKVSLVRPADRRKIVPEFNFEGLLRADSHGRAALYASGSQNGWLMRSEIRNKENLPFVPGSDVLTVQSNLRPIDQLGVVAPDQTEAGFGLPPPPQNQDAAKEPIKQ